MASVQLDSDQESTDGEESTGEYEASIQAARSNVIDPKRNLDQCIKRTIMLNNKITQIMV